MYQLGQVFGCNAEFIGIEGDLVLFPKMEAEFFHELLEESLLPALRRFA
ncbi:MAG: hypothetical protein IJ651_02470 [Bacteroidales bacterium]|nr:hypothetical protein [Bacteroidales bacterium]